MENDIFQQTINIASGLSNYRDCLYTLLLLYKINPFIIVHGRLRLTTTKADSKCNY